MGSERFLAAAQRRKQQPGAAFEASQAQPQSMLGEDPPRVFEIDQNLRLGARVACGDGRANARARPTYVVAGLAIHVRGCLVRLGCLDIAPELAQRIGACHQAQCAYAAVRLEATNLLGDLE